MTSPSAPPAAASKPIDPAKFSRKERRGFPCGVTLRSLQACPMQHIRDIAREAGIAEEYLEQYGNYKAKIDTKFFQDHQGPDGKLILVTAITPTPAGEGEDHHHRGPSRRPAKDRQEIRGGPAGALSGPGLRPEGAGRRRRLCPGGAYGGHQPPLHRGLPRHWRSQ